MDSVCKDDTGPGRGVASGRVPAWCPPAQPVVRTESHVLDIAYVLGAIALFVLCDLAVKGAKSLS
ncbi:hypothetical protein H640_02530 [Cutibacterium granulosum TM11]|uniref:Uncharacterized protein n=2 Tax=Cutibacterium granulosum TaxID=33011 RepID=A0A9X5R3Q3_9ACTN|nr:hypothetical protein [Cutibacterium granulosum]ERF67535.1 hypothetical protein H640_02530 [Cutibacterium granulosum TM11]MEA5664135.1 hypothetical protein [Cutibacterium granulosum]